MKHCDIVIPVYNEAANLEALHRRLTAVMEGLPFSYGVIFVDDGSTDGSAEALEQLAALDPRVKYIVLSRNFGHQVALVAGLEHAHGDAVITMDGDLQHPPEVIPQLLRKWQEGCEVVTTIREDPASLPLFKRVTARIFYGLLNRMTDVRIVPGSADFRLLDRQVVTVLRTFREKHKFLRGLVSWIGFRSTSITYQAEERHAGQPKYSLARMVRFAWDGITAFSTVPLRVAFYVGLVISLLSFAYAVFAIAAHTLGHMTIPGWTSILVSVLFLGGLQLVVLGMLGEYIARIFEEVKDRPLYVVRRSRL